ncbi:MAG: type II secretion system protein [Phycisphaerales bacterium]|nr:MAG: type II secretion system protein [Phycisphaerales bacterium]
MATEGLSRRNGSRGGFTLIEMLITIGIIVMLAALTVTVSVAVIRKSEVGRTETVLRVLDVAMSEWEAEADRKLSWGENPLPPDPPAFDIGDGTPHVFTLSEVLLKIRRNDRVSEILSRIEADLVYTYDQAKPVPPWLPVMPDADDPDPFLGWGNPRALVEAGMADGSVAVLDAWGVPIRAVHPGRLHSPGSPWFDTGEKDLDGTVFIDSGFQGANEEIYGRARNRQVLFISAGPDGKFGNLSSADARIRRQAADNVCSYPPEGP